MQLHVWHRQSLAGAISINDEGRWSFDYAPSWKGFALSPFIRIGEARKDLLHQRTGDQAAG